MIKKKQIKQKTKQQQKKHTQASKQDARWLKVLAATPITHVWSLDSQGREREPTLVS